MERKGGKERLIEGERTARKGKGRGKRKGRETWRCHCNVLDNDHHYAYKKKQFDY